VLQVVSRLREFASLRAIEIKSAAATAAAATFSTTTTTPVIAAVDEEVITKPAVVAATPMNERAADNAQIARDGSSRMPCKLQMRIAQVKADLICQHEKKILVPAGGAGASSVLRMLRPVIQRMMNPSDKLGAASSASDSAFGALYVASQASAAASAAAGVATSLVGLSCIVTSYGAVCLPNPLCFFWFPLFSLVLVLVQLSFALIWPPTSIAFKANQISEFKFYL
jgi:hypothetical protein